MQDYPTLAFLTPPLLLRSISLSVSSINVLDFKILRNSFRERVRNSSLKELFYNLDRPKNVLDGKIESGEHKR